MGTPFIKSRVKSYSPKFINCEKGNRMNKPTANFKLSKPTKTLMASITDPIARAGFKNAMIDAEICKAKRPRSRKEEAVAAGAK